MPNLELSSNYKLKKKKIEKGETTLFLGVVVCIKKIK